VAGDFPRIPIFNCPLAMCTLSLLSLSISFFYCFLPFLSSPLKDGHDGCIDIEKGDQVQVFPTSVKSDVKTGYYEG